MVHGASACRGDDDWVAISLRDDAGCQAFCRASGDEAWLDDPRFADPALRTEQHDALDALIGEWTSASTKFEVAALLQAAGVPAGPILKADEVIADPQLAAREFFDELPIGDFGRVPIQRYLPAKFDGEGIAAGGPAPDLGADTEEVLAQLGLDAAAIADLLERRVVDGAANLRSDPVARQGQPAPARGLRADGLGAAHRPRVRAEGDLKERPTHPSPFVEAPPPHPRQAGLGGRPAASTSPDRLSSERSMSSQRFRAVPD